MFIKIVDHVLKIENINYSYYDEANELLKIFYDSPLSVGTPNVVTYSLLKGYFEFKLTKAEHDEFVNALIE